MVLAAVAGATVMLFRGKPVPVTAVAPAPHIPLAVRSEAGILAQTPDTMLASRFMPNPAILVLDFPNLAVQGQTFNRIAAFIEKRDLPRDRVLNDVELAAAIQQDSATVETYYYGHDYTAFELQRFFATADRQGLTLGPLESQLRTLLQAEGMLKPGAREAVISIPREGSDPFVDASGRASLLRHELSHGEYFTNAAYAQFARHFWDTEMTEEDRTNFRAFLVRQGYDPTNLDLIVNETQAHLMHTTDDRYFNSRNCGIPSPRVAALRATFLQTMPRGWLQEAAASVKALP